MKSYCPECGCTMTVISNTIVCDDPECAYIIHVEENETD